MIYKYTNQGYDILKAQYLFFVFYILTILFVILIYKHSQLVICVKMLFYIETSWIYNFLDVFYVISCSCIVYITFTQ